MLLQLTVKPQAMYYVLAKTGAKLLTVNYHYHYQCFSSKLSVVCS